MISRASVELIQNLMSSRFEHMACYSKYTWLQWNIQDASMSVHLHHSGSFTQQGKLTCNFPICLLRQDDSEGDQLLDTQSVISRFRANLVIAGVEPFEEDNWSHLVIGSTQFMVSWHFEINDEIFNCGFVQNEYAPSVINLKVAGHCGRCHMVGIDQDTGSKTKEPLMSLSAYRSGKVSQKQLLHLHVDALCGCVFVCVCVATQTLLFCDLFIFFDFFLGDLWCLPDPSANRGPHRSSQCPLGRFPHTAQAKQFLKQSSATSS